MEGVELMPFPLLDLGNHGRFHWKSYTTEVERDIEIAKGKG
jgi:hypothetical protein